MNNLELEMARRVHKLLRERVAAMALKLRAHVPYLPVMALGDQLRVSLRKSARARALVLRALRNSFKP